MKKIIVLLVGSFALLSALGIEVKEPYARATPVNTPNSAAFMTLENKTNKDISLIEVTSDIAQATELHTSDVKDGVRTMYKVEKVDIPANSSTILKPGGFHIMFIGLKKPLKVGEKIEINLGFSNDTTQTIKAEVKDVMHHHDMKQK